MSIEIKITRASYFKEESVFNYEEYIRNLCKMLQQITNIGSPLHLMEEVPYLINNIKIYNYDMNMGEITVKTDII